MIMAGIFDLNPWIIRTSFMYDLYLHPINEIPCDMK